jgi:hypothetical protein
MLQVVFATRIIATLMVKTDLQSIKVRLYFLDWLRVLAFGLLVFYHSGLIFVDWGFHIRNNSVTDILKPPLLFLNQWRLPLLFFVSGAGTFFALGKRTGSVFVKERFVRLFIPLVFGILIIIPRRAWRGFGRASLWAACSCPQYMNLYAYRQA